MLNKKNPLAKCYQNGGVLKPKKKTNQSPSVAWSDDIRNPENAEYVSEIAFNKGLKEYWKNPQKKVTQQEFNERYRETLSDSTLNLMKKRKK